MSKQFFFPATKPKSTYLQALSSSKEIQKKCETTLELLHKSKNPTSCYGKFPITQNLTVHYNQAFQNRKPKEKIGK